MTDNNNENVGQEAPTDNGGEGNQRSEKRYQDLANKVREAEEAKAQALSDAEAKIAEANKKAAEAEFKANFAELKGKYPTASEFEQDIRTKTSSGYTLEDAIVSTLASKGKLPVAPADKVEHLGGSAATSVHDTKANDPSFGGDVAKLREELVRLEGSGEIGMRF